MQRLEERLLYWRNECGNVGDTGAVGFVARRAPFRRLLALSAWGCTAFIPLNLQALSKSVLNVMAFDTGVQL